MLKKYSYIILIISSFILWACGENSKHPEDSEEIQIETKEKDASENSRQEQLNAAKEIFYMLPSPVEVTTLIKKTGASYNPQILNNPNNIDNYLTTKELAISLGVYATDLSYVSIYNQTQEAMFYMSACKKASEKIGLEKAFNESVMARFEDNLENPDSLLYIISDAYWLADAYLKDQERAKISNYIIFGGWIEGMYIAAKTAQQAPENQAIIQRIAEQKFSLNHLIKLYQDQPDEDDTDILNDLQKLQKIYDHIIVHKTQTSIQEKEGKKALSGGETFQIPPEVLVELTTQIETIRNKYI